MKKAVALICLLVLLLSMAGCQKKVYTGENIGTTCANITMGAGSFAYNNGFVYYSDFGYIYEYDIESRKTVVLSLKDTIQATSLFSSDNYVFFTSDGLNYITKDGKREATLFERTEGCRQFYADGKYAYYLDYIEGSLYRRDMETETEQMLISGVLSYYVDDTFIYVVTKQDDKRHLLFSAKDNIRFEEIALSFQPIAVNANSEGIFLSKMGTYQIVQYTSQTETILPICSTYYQILDGCVIYSDSSEFNNSCFPVKCYDLETGKETLLYENVFDFCILQDRYICCKNLTGANSFSFTLLDIKTGEAVQMPTEAI